MAEKHAVEVPVIKPTTLVVSPDARGDAALRFETAAESDIVIVLPMTALAELAAMLARASLEQAKTQPKQ